MVKIMKINFPQNQNAYGTLKYNQKQYKCLGKLNYPYIKDCAITTKDKHHNHLSKQFNCKLPWGILIDGNRGIYIHEDVSSQNKDLGHLDTHGCINLLPGDAEELYHSVTENTRVLITYNW